MSLTGDYYYDVVVKRDDDEDDPIILDGVEVLVEVLEDGVWDDSQIYYNENLSDVKDNPFVTEASGEVAFWASKGEYRITISDLEDPPRIEPRELVWMSIPYADFDKLRWPGEIVMTGRDVPPDGWLLCDGSPISRTAYAKLFNAIGIKYGPGDGGTTFNLPPFNKRFPIGAGEDLDVGSTDEMDEEDRSPAHLHTQPTHTHAMSHTHIGGTDNEAANSTSGDGAHAHTFADGKQIASRQTDTLEQETPTGDDSKLQTLYMPGFNTGEGSAAAPMDEVDDHTHTVAAHAHDVGVGEPSAGSTSASGGDDTGTVTVPHVGVNFFIKT